MTIFYRPFFIYIVCEIFTLIIFLQLHKLSPLYAFSPFKFFGMSGGPVGVSASLFA